MGTAVLVYGLLAASGTLWALLAGRSPLWLETEEAWLGTWLPSPLARSVVSLLLGVSVALMAVRGTRVLVQRTTWAKRLHIELRGMVGPLSGAAIAFFALTTGVVEELFFRGAMQPAFGLLLTSLVFGAVHVGPTRAFLPWTLWAAIMGAVFGLLYALTGSLVGPIAAHVLINYENMHYLVSYDPVTVARERRITPEAPTLVGAPVRTGGRPTPNRER
jgi:membrane protease YdiL (CAAX protease family)